MVWRPFFLDLNYIESAPCSIDKTHSYKSSNQFAPKNKICKGKIPACEAINPKKIRKLTSIERKLLKEVNRYNGSNISK